MKRKTDFGLLVLRLGIGVMFLFHGAPKLMGGSERWSMLGTAVTSLGIPLAPAFWGFMASVSEFFGAIFLILGLFCRGASFLLLVTMGFAASWHLAKGDGLMGSSHAIELAVVFLSLLLAGPGRFSLDERLRPLGRLAGKLRSKR